MMIKPTIGFVGMTHLGLVSGVSAAEKGFQVVCFDQDFDKIRALKAGHLPVSEPQLDELVIKNSNQILFSSSAPDLEKCDIVYVAPDIPTNDFGKSDLGPIDELLSLVFEVTRSDAVIVVLSQVPPGFSRKKFRLNRIYYYQVETLIFGCAVDRALNPERYIIGCADPQQALPLVYEEFLNTHNCPILKMRFESAELAKISINMCLVASVSTANTMAELCEKIGADWSEIIPALKLDKRIGQYSYLAPGLGIAGGNLERDLTTVCNFSDEFGTDSGVVRSWISNSRHRRDWPLRVLHEEVLRINPQAVIGVWGLAYKENTHSIKNSPSIALLKAIPDCFIRFFDPVVSVDVVPNRGYVASISELDACTGADVLVIMTPWPQFSKISITEIAKKMKGNIILDPFKVLDAKKCREVGIRYFTLGVSN
jgi:UDPglucose 6-dehydrogenase